MADKNGTAKADAGKAAGKPALLSDGNPQIPVRYFHVHEDDLIDEALFADW